MEEVYLKMMSSIFYGLEFLVGYLVPAIIYLFLVPLTLFSNHSNALNILYLFELVVVCLVGLSGCYSARKFYTAMSHSKLGAIRRYEFYMMVASNMAALYFVINLWGKGIVFLAFIAQLVVNFHCIFRYKKFRADLKRFPESAP